MLREILLLIVSIAMMRSAREFLPGDNETLPAAGVCLGFGFLVLTSVQAGAICERIKLPRLTGYFIAGFLCGPEVSGLLSRGMVQGLRVFSGAAVGLIAMIAGSEVDVALLRNRMRSVVTISGIALPMTWAVMALALLAASPLLPFIRDVPIGARLLIAAILGLVLSATSPSAALGVLKETRSAGPLSETVLGTVVLLDFVVIFAFAFLHALAYQTLGGQGAVVHPMVEAVIAVFGSIAVGVAIAGAFALYLRRVGSRVGLFAVAIVLGAATVGDALHLDVLIVCLTAGLSVENVYRVSASTMRREIGPIAMPVLAIFFAVSGARLQIRDLTALWPFALAFAALRAATLIYGVRIGTRQSNADPIVQRWAPYGLLSQVGISAGLVLSLEHHFPSWGVAARPLVATVIVLNQLVGPILLRFILLRSGEAGAVVDSIESASSSARHNDLKADASSP